MKLKKILAQSLAVAMVLSVFQLLILQHLQQKILQHMPVTMQALLMRRQMHFRHHMDTKICS